MGTVRQPTGRAGDDRGRRAAARRLHSEPTDDRSLAAGKTLAPWLYEWLDAWPYSGRRHPATDARRPGCSPESDHHAEDTRERRNRGSARGSGPSAGETRLGAPAITKCRVALLPYLDQKPLYEKFHLDEPWDGPHNKGLVEQIPEVDAPVIKKDEPTDST